MNKSDISYIQLLNHDLQPCFVDLLYGRVFWLIPDNNILYRNVKYLTHLVENGDNEGQRLCYIS